MMPRRKIASIAAVSGVVLYLATIGHLALVPHVLCEHGDLIDAAAQEFSSTGQPPKSPGAGLHSALPSAGEHISEGHQHCVVASNQRNQLPDPGEVLVLVALLEPPPPAVAAIAPLRLPAIEFAPKQSPPA